MTKQLNSTQITQEKTEDYQDALNQLKKLITLRRSIIQRQLGELFPRQPTAN
jgi:hypothetical protein